MFNNQYYKKKRYTINYKEIIKLSGVLVVLTILWAFFQGGSRDVKKDEKTIQSFALKGVVSKEYSSIVRVYLTKEDKIIEMNIEEYLTGVLSGEMPVSFEMEALKAQGVAARTYVLGKTINKCPKGKGADVCDTVHCQVYKAKDAILSGWPESKREEFSQKILRAVNETAGEVLTYNNDLVMNAQYFSTSWGRTEDSVAVYGKDIPYLKSVDSSGEEISNRFNNVNTFSYKEFVSKINSAFPDAALKESTLSKDIEIISRNSSGSVKEIKLGGAVVSGVKLRSALGLYSANFTINIGKEIKVSSTGYGHGLGMSQWGANAMAKEGKNHREILLHYYSGVSIETIRFQ